MQNKNKEFIEKTLRKIRDIRKSKGLSIENIALELDISSSAYNKLERNQTSLSLERLLFISDVLGVSLGDLLDIKTGDVLHQGLKDYSIGKEEAWRQENREVYERLIASKDEQIAFLKSLLSTNL